MKKISLLTKIIFHIINIGTIILYLYPGSILGWLFYNDFHKQPQLSANFIISSNHFYAFTILSMLGLISFRDKKLTYLFIYLFSISIFLEFFHMIIPNRDFEYSDLFGNFFGVCFVFIFSIFINLLKKNK
jgi:hypothetical protein|tara:strand:- start:393 stop:782 length:390 start_codon:yes stop_codon:yes gene_type:complete